MYLSCPFHHIVGDNHLKGNLAKTGSSGFVYWWFKYSKIELSLID